MSRLLRCSRGHLFSDHLAGCDQCALVAPLAATVAPPVASGVPASFTPPVSAPVTEPAPPRKKRRGLVLLFSLLGLFALAFVATRVLGLRPASENPVVTYQAPAAVATRTEPPPSPQLLPEPAPKREEAPPMSSEEITIEPIVPDYIPPTGERDPVVSLRICEASGKLANSNCPNVVRRRFRLLDRPTEICTLHSGSFRPAPPSYNPSPVAPKPVPKPAKPVEVKPTPKPPATKYVQRTVCPDSGLLANRYCPQAVIRRYAQGTEPTAACGQHSAPKPEMVEVRVCEDTHLRANANCPNTSVQSFAKGSEPSGVCTVHAAAPPPVVKVDPPAPKPTPVADTKGIQIMICRDSGERATPYCTNTESRTFPKGGSPRKCHIHRGPRGSNTDEVEVQVCADTGLLPTAYCPNREFRRFRRSDRPKDRCDVHHG